MSFPERELSPYNSKSELYLKGNALSPHFRHASEVSFENLIKGFSLLLHNTRSDSTDELPNASTECSISSPPQSIFKISSMKNNNTILEKKKIKPKLQKGKTMKAVFGDPEEKKKLRAKREISTKDVNKVQLIPHKKKAYHHFTKEEDEKLIKLVEKYHEPHWARMALEFPGRTRRQLHDRWSSLKLMTSVKETAEWTPEKDVELMKLVKDKGHQWRSFANEFFRDRTHLWIKNRYYERLKQFGEGQT